MYTILNVEASPVKHPGAEADPPDGREVTSVVFSDSRPTAIDLGQFGPWFSPAFDDEARIRMVVEAETLGFSTAWLGIGRRSMHRLELVERALEATSTMVVTTSVLNIWTNDPDVVATSYGRIAGRFPGRLLIGLGLGHPESAPEYRAPYATLVRYLDRLDAGGLPPEGRVIAALGPNTLRLARERSAGSHPYLVGPRHTRMARQMLGPGATLAPEQTVVIGTDGQLARKLAREFLNNPYLHLENYVNNLLRHGFTRADIAGGGSDHLVTTLVSSGRADVVAEGLQAHLEAGADHVAVQALTGDGDPMEPFRQLAPVLLG